MTIIVRRFRKEDAKQLSKIIKENLSKITYKEDSKKTINLLIKSNLPKELIKKSKTRNYFVAVEEKKILGVGGV